MAAADLAAVAEIEGQEPSSWSEPSIAAELQRGDALSAVVCLGETVVGWGCCRYSSCESELLKIGILRRFRRQRLGSRLLDYFLTNLQQRGVEELFLEVRSRNNSALSFYRNSGFTDVGRRIRYYKQPLDDALILRKPIESPKTG